jgi:hypothetical protein
MLRILNRISARSIWQGKPASPPALKVEQLFVRARA